MKQSKISTLVSFVSDPYHALLFKKSFERWGDEIDQLLVCVNGNIPEVNKFIGGLYATKIILNDIVVFNESISQGKAFDVLYPQVTGDILMTLCSDNYILKKGIVNGFKKDMEQYDAVGSMGLHASANIAQKIAEKIGTVRLNPFMSFWHKDKLDEIKDLTFDAVFWEAEQGYKIPEIDFETNEGGHLDIMSLMSIKYMAKNRNVKVIPPEQVPNWVHVSGMSSGVIHYFDRGDGKSFYGKDLHVGSIGITTLGWFLFAYEETVKDCPLEEFNKKYYMGLVEKIVKSGHKFEDVKAEAERIRMLWSLQ